MNLGLNLSEYLDLVVLGEPLACVMHAYRRLPITLTPKIITIYGGGSIGTLHALYSHKLYPLVKIQLVEPDIRRRKILFKLLPFLHIFSDTSNLQKSNLAIVATSEAIASLNAIENSNDSGSVILFSGINHKNNSELPIYEGQKGMGYLSPSMKHLGIHVDGCFATLGRYPQNCIRIHDIDYK